MAKPVYALVNGVWTLVGSTTAHAHTVADVTGLQAALDAKADTSHAHTEADISDLGAYPDSTGQVAAKIPTTDGSGGWTFEDPGGGGLGLASYVGDWNGASTYEAGAIVSHDGRGWVANGPIGTGITPAESTAVAISYVGAGTIVSRAGTSGTINANPPAASVPGDLLILYIQGYYSLAAVSSIAGWTRLDTDSGNRIRIFYRIATGTGDSASLTVAQTGMQIAAFRANRNWSALTVSSSADSSNAPAPTVPGLVGPGIYLSFHDTVGWDGDTPSAITNPGLANTMIGGLDGNDHYFQWMYDILYDSEFAAPPTFSMTGGTAQRGHSVGFTLLPQAGTWVPLASRYTLYDENTPITQRNAISFTGAGVQVTDDPGNDRSLVTIPSIVNYSGTWAANITYNEGSLVHHQQKLWLSDGLSEIGIEPGGTALTFKDSILTFTPDVLIYGSINANDESGNGRNATAVGAVTYGVAGVDVNNVMRLNGTSYLEVTYGAWMNSDSISLIALVKTTTGGTLLCRQDSDSGNQSYRLSISMVSGIPSVFIRYGSVSSYHSVSGTTDLRDGEWHVVIATRSGAVTSVYVDGVVEGSASAGSGIYDSAQTLLIGARDDDPPGAYFAGDLAVAITAALTAPQVAQVTASALTSPYYWVELAPQSASTSAHTIENETVAMAQRSKLNFAGSGVSVTDDSGNDRTTININLPISDGSSSLQHIRLQQTSGQTITNDTYGPFLNLVWGEVSSGESGWWSAGNPSRVTVPVDGTYLFSANWRHNGTGAAFDHMIGAEVNNVVVGGSRYLSTNDAAQGYTQLLTLSAGDYVETFVYQTTGSSKTTNINATQMSLVRIDQPIGGINKSLFDAKGDLIVASAPDTEARLPVGTNGQILLADSAEATGLKWVDSSTIAPSYSTDLGAITGGVPVTITHNLNTYDVVVQILEKDVAGAGGAAGTVTDATVEITSADTVDITFVGNAVANLYRVTVVAVGGTGSNSSTITSDRVLRTAGDLTFNTTGWQDVSTALDMTIAATSGDLIEYGVSFWTEAAAVSLSFDVCTVVSGSPVNYFVSAGSGSHNGVMGWYAAQTMHGTISGSVDYVAQPGDISGGSITLRLRVRPSNTVPRTILANSDNPLIVWCRNYGAAS